MNDAMLAALGGIPTVPFGTAQAGGGAPAPGQQPAFAASQPQRMLDLVFILDCTGSMGSYIASATKNIELICENIVHSGSLPSADCLRIGLIAYRDYPPQDNSYITKSFPFTSSVPTMKEQLKSLYASGGGDGPEGVTAGIKAAMELDWRADAAKMCVLIADAPCHGIGEYGDGFPQGGPDGEDPLILARQMAAAGIPLFVVACEPALSGYQFGLDWFRALTVITSALLVPLTTASLLSHVIVGSALEHLEMERLIHEVGQAVAERIHAGLQTVDDVARELHERLLLRGEETKQLKFESIHVRPPASALSGVAHRARCADSFVSSTYSARRTRRGTTSRRSSTRPTSNPPSPSSRRSAARASRTSTSRRGTTRPCTAAAPPRTSSTPPSRRGLAPRPPRPAPRRGRSSPSSSRSRRARGSASRMRRWGSMSRTRMPTRLKRRRTTRWTSSRRASSFGSRGSAWSRRSASPSRARGAPLRREREPRPPRRPRLPTATFTTSARRPPTLLPSSHRPISPPPLSPPPPPSWSASSRVVFHRPLRPPPLAAYPTSQY